MDVVEHDQTRTDRVREQRCDRLEQALPARRGIGRDPGLREAIGQVRRELVQLTEEGRRGVRGRREGEGVADELRRTAGRARPDRARTCRRSPSSVSSAMESMKRFTSSALAHPALTGDERELGFAVDRALPGVVEGVELRGRDRRSRPVGGSERGGAARAGALAVPASGLVTMRSAIACSSGPGVTPWSSSRASATREQLERVGLACAVEQPEHELARRAPRR